MRKARNIMNSDGLRRPRKIMSATSSGEPSSPSPRKGKRPLMTSQTHHGHPPPAMKKSKFEKEIMLKILFPNETMVTFMADSQTIHSVKQLLDMVNSEISDSQLLGTRASVKSRPLEWGSHVKLQALDQGGSELNDDSLHQIMQAAKRSSTVKFLVNDGHKDCSYKDPDMWDVTPKPELLGRHPQGYTLETALADHVDNAIQAVYNIEEVQHRVISVNLTPDKITIFDTGPGMDANENGDNCIKNWGTMGASTHRAVNRNAIGGEPPFLTPFLGKYGVGGISAAFFLGECVDVCSKTKQSDKVVSLRMERKILVERSQEESEDQFEQHQYWKAPGSIRNMTNEERRMSPQGSFTKVVITKLKQHAWEVENVRQLLKDIYYPYIQTEIGPSRKTVFPVTIVVNDMNLTEVENCETAISRLHTCNGNVEFLIHIHLKKVLDRGDKGTQGKPMMEGANARISCQYYPNLKGKEELEAVVEELHSLRPKDRSLTFETINRVIVRWLGRSLPDVKWPVFPFMEPHIKKDQRGLKRWAKRVRAFVDTDAGFHPVQIKTDLDRTQPFVEVLKNIGGKLEKCSASEVEVTIKRGEEKVKPSELGELYLKWLTEMHHNFDEELIGADDDEETFIINPSGLGDSQCIIIHTHMKDSKHHWKVDDSNPIFLKLPKGPGLKADKYVTLEYFFHDVVEGFQVNFLCRGIEVDASEGCQITKLREGNPYFELNRSQWFPATMLDTAKRLDLPAWTKKREEISNKLPGKIEVLNGEESEKFELCEAFPVDGSKLEAGFSLPKDFIVVVRPRKGAGATFKQGCIVPDPMTIKLTVTHCSYSNLEVPHTNDDHARELCNLTSKSTAINGVKGLYVFSTESSEFNCLLNKGTYTFRFTLESEKYNDVQPAVSLIEILPSATTSKWTFCNHPGHCKMSDHENTKDNAQRLVIRLNEPVKEHFFLQKYDQYGNIQDFETPLNLDLVGVSCKGDSLDMHTKVRCSIVAGTPERQRLLVKRMLFEKASLKQLGSAHEALLQVCLAEEKLVDIKFEVLPGVLENVEVTRSDPQVEFMRFEEPLKPGEVIRNLTIQGLDSSMNTIEKGQKLVVVLEGVEFQDDCGSDRVVDENGMLQLGGLLKVTCLYNSTGSISFYADTKFISSITFNTVTRRLRVDQVPAAAFVGRKVEGTIVQMVDESDEVDTSVSVDKSITVDWQPDETYPFIKGVCVLPGIQMPEKPGPWTGNVSLVGDQRLCYTLMIELKLATASSLGPATKGKEILNAECGMPMMVPFRVYDENHKLALLTDVQRESISVNFEPRKEESVDYPLCRSITVQHMEVKMSMVDGIHIYEAHIVVSGSVGMYIVTVTDKSNTLDGKAQSICRVHHGRVAQLVLARSDGQSFQEYVDSDEGPLPVIVVKRCSNPMPHFFVTLRDSADNICSSCDDRTVKMKLLEWPQCRAPVAQTTEGIARLECSLLEAPVGRYHVVIELERSGEELYSLEEQVKPLQAHLSLKMTHGNYPSEMSLPDFDPVSISLTDEQIQYLPPLSILVKSADGLRFKSRPKVGVKLLSDGSELMIPSGLKEYFGEFFESCKTEVKSLTRLNGDQELSSYQCRYDFRQVCAPSQAGTYRMEFFVVDSDVSRPNRALIVRHGLPNTISITPRATGREISVLKVKIVDAHSNPCESVGGMQLNLKFTIRRAFTLGSLQGKVNPCTILSRSTALVEAGTGDFGVFEVTQGTPGSYCLEISLAQEEGQIMDLRPFVAHVFAIKGNINQSFVQLLNQNSKVIENCETSIKTCKIKIHLKEIEVNAFELRKQNFEAELVSQGHERTVLMAQQHEGNDAAIINAEKEQPVRGSQNVVYELKHVARNSAPLAFWEFLESPTLPIQLRTEFVGLVVMLARVENDALNRMLAEYLGQATLLLIITQTQRGVEELDVHDADGQIDENRGLHGFARSRNYNLSGKYEALPLTDTKPYRPAHGAAVNMEHHQRILNINPPLLPSRQVPAGFLGYAVNLVNLAHEHLQMRVNTQSHGEVGLRESLFFYLLRKLQVYDTRRNMISAKECLGRLEGGAISLDGGLIKPNGRQQLGQSRNNHVKLRFGLVPYDEKMQMGSLMPAACGAIERRRKYVAINKNIDYITHELRSLTPALEKGIAELKDLKTTLRHSERKQKVAQDSLKATEGDINELQAAAHAEAARNGDTQGRDRPNSQASDNLKMRAFFM
ncbi:unnamed protein product [Calypogeia fissa]